MTQGFRIEALNKSHDRTSFCCGVEALDVFLRELAMQDMRRRVGNCFVALDEAGSIAAYYSFAATSISLSELPADLARRLPRYGVAPAGLIGRLAVDRRFQGLGILGGALIMDAVTRAARSDSAIFALTVDAKNDRAISFYRRYGFQPFVGRANALFLPIATALKALSDLSE